MTDYEVAMLVVSIFIALGTVSAVILSLGQFLFSKRRKIKLDCRDTKILDSQNNLIPVIKIFVTNIGRRKIDIISWGIYLKDASDHKSLEYTKIQEATEVNVDSTAIIINKIKSIKNSLNSYSRHYSADIISSDNMLQFYLIDGLGQRHFVNAKHSIKYYANYVNV